MGAWKSMGSWIGHHMSIIAPVCVAFGVAFPDQIGVLRPLVMPMFAFMTFQSSLNNRFGNLAEVVRRPAPMIATIAIASVAMPVLACLLGTLFFGASPQIVCGIVLEYSVPVAVTASMWTNVFDGDIALCLATILVSTVAAPFSIPATLQLLLGQTVAVDVASMMGEMLVTIALPALAGTALNDATHGRAATGLAPALSPAAKIVLVLVITTNSTGVASYMRNLTPELVGVLAFILLFATSGYAAGLLLALVWRRPRGQLVTMTFLTGMRNISAGAVIAAQYFPGKAMFPVVIGTLFQQVLAGCYGTLMERVVLPRLGDAGAEGSGAAAGDGAGAGPAGAAGTDDAKTGA